MSHQLEPTPQDLIAIEAEGLDPYSDSLEDLYTDALLRAPTKRNAKKVEAAKAVAGLSFAFPDAWHRTRGVSVIHRETDTLLGNFSEYLHNSVAGCRRLVRESSPISVEGIEYVEGTWWLEEDLRPADPGKWHDRKRANANLHLPGEGLFAPLTEVEVCLSFGSIARIELAAETQFSCSIGNTLVTMPKGLDIRRLLSDEVKAIIRHQVLDFFGGRE